MGRPFTGSSSNALNCVLNAILLSASVVNVQAAVGPVGDLMIANKVIQPDGFARSAVLAGSTAEGLTFPGPLVVGNKGDHFKVNVIDALTDATMLKSTSIHWHGILQDGSSWADGSAAVTQCPIASNHSFLYEFDVPDQAGTFWYHSHLSTQYCDGLRGPMVIYDPKDPHKHLYDVDDESTIITLSDWYHKPAPSYVGGLPPLSEATLINGLGRFAGGPESPLAVITVRRGTRYRFRIINMSCDPNFKFSIDQHTFTVIEADGENTKAAPNIDSIQIYAGQRYSAILHANQPVSNYWIRANPNADRGTSGFENNLNMAVLRYVGAPVQDPTTVIRTPKNALMETKLSALENPRAPGRPVPGGADVNIYLPFHFIFNKLQFEINGATWIPPTVPVLLQILSGAKTVQELMPQGSYYALPPNKTIEISIPGMQPGGPHPWHLHGHSFSVVRSAESDVYNFKNPVRRDVVNTGDPGSNVTIRFQTDNSGPWYLHCHIDWHIEFGLAVIMAEDQTDNLLHSPTPDAWADLCPIYNSLSPQELGGIN